MKTEGIRMRVPFIIARLVVATAGLGLLAASAEGATNLNSSKSNIYRPITSAAGETACVKAGGTVVIVNRIKSCMIASVYDGPTSATKQLCNNPDSLASCCRAWGGTWVTGGSDGFCYRNL
jgi:hypothetical protein